MNNTNLLTFAPPIIVLIILVLALLQIVFGTKDLNSKVDSGAIRRSDRYQLPEKQNCVAQIRKLYNMEIKQSEEIEVPIKKIFLYPVRGARGIEMDWVQITPFGLKNDRTWMVIRESKMAPISNHNSHIPTFLRMEYDQVNKPNELVLKLMDD